MIKSELKGDPYILYESPFSFHKDISTIVLLRELLSGHM